MIPEEDFTITDKGTLQFREGIINTEPEVYTIEDSQSVLYELVEQSQQPLYYTYKNICKKEDKHIFIENNIRFNLLMLMPGKIGKEYIKTVGHFHSKKANSSETFSEYFQVLLGEAIILLQKNNMSGEVEEIVAVEAKKGDIVYIPSGYGHIIINPGEDFLVVANLLARNCQPIYEPFQLKHGAAYYYIEGENGKADWIKNKNYKVSVGLKMKGAPNMEQPIKELEQKSLYEAFITSPEDFNILK